MASIDPAVLVEDALGQLAEAGNYLYFGTARESALSRRIAQAEQELHRILHALKDLE